MTYQKSLVLLDNLRIGGLERLAMDQLFMLADLNLHSDAYYRQVEATLAMPNFLMLETKRISEKRISIYGLPKTDFYQVVQLARVIRRQQIDLIINHSIGAGLIARLASMLARRKVVIKTFVHQLPTLSAPIQRMKRFLYAFASSEIFGYSEAVVRDWNSRINKGYLPAFIKSKLQIRLLRNGIYLGRLPRLVSSGSKFDSPRLLFIGRNVAWKNLGLVLDLLRHESLKKFEALIVLPSIDEEIRMRLESEFASRVTFAIGKTIEHLHLSSKDINIYPVNYGPKARHIESISLNCLEMACIGIPSVVTYGGNVTWTELSSLGLIHEVNWGNRYEVVSKIVELSESPTLTGHITLVQNLVDIKNNLRQILESGEDL